MPDCEGCDCDCIKANINYYSAAITVDQAALNVAQNQLMADQTAYYYWQYRSYMCNCGQSSSSSSSSAMSMSSMSSSSDGGQFRRSTASPVAPAFTPEQFKTIVDGVARMNEQYRILAGQLAKITK